MADEQNKGSDNSLQNGLNAANTVRGAIKAGKAVAGIAKGAASGGPYGAIVMGLWQNRKIIFKVVAAGALLILIPVIFLLMLPGLVINAVGGLISGLFFSDDAAVIQNLVNAQAVVTTALDASYQQTLAIIQTESAKVPSGEIIVIYDWYQGGHSADTTLIISQYCASKNDNMAVDTADFAAVIQNSGIQFYTYTLTTNTATDSTTNITTTTHTYTVVYAGDHIFADEVFHLTQEQRILANNYTQNLSLFLYGSDYQGGKSTVSAEVLQYEPLLMKYAQEYGIENYIEILKAMMMQESGGRGFDPMQSSECVYNTLYPQSPNGITDPDYSINAEVHYFADCLTMAGCTSPSDKGKVSLALQGYNFGSGYITWALNKYGGYTTINAVEFANIQKANLGLMSYGDTEYVAHVLRYYQVPGVGGTISWGSPFVGRDWRAAVTSECGDRVHPISKTTEFHNGIDIAYPTGTAINAVKSGKVTYSGENGNGLGKHIVVDCGDGYTVTYGHCSSLLVSAGQTIATGDIIAKVGSTGYSTGPHLHLTIKLNGNVENPRKYIP